MRRLRRGALVAIVSLAVTSSPFAQTGTAKTTQKSTTQAPQKSSGQVSTAKSAARHTAKAPAKAAKTPAKSAAAKKAEAANRRKEFEEMIVAQERQAWAEEKNQNADHFREAMTDQFVAAEVDGKRYTKADVLPLIPTVKMTAYELSDIQVIRAGRDAAIVTYRVGVTLPAEGKETTTNFLGTTVWVRRGKEWKMTFHQKTLAP